MGVWYWDLETGELHWDEQMFRLFGVDPETFGGRYEDFARTLHPDDLVKVSHMVQHSVHTHGGCQAKFRAGPDMENLREILASGHVSPDGKYMTGICQPASHFNDTTKP